MLMAKIMRMRQEHVSGRALSRGATTTCRDILWYVRK